MIGKTNLHRVLISLTVVGAALVPASNGFAFSSYGTSVNSLCAPVQPYTGNCALCHVADRGASTPAKTAFLAGGTTLTNFFCPAPPPPPPCTDQDGDTYAREGGSCGPVDCNDTDAAIKPGAVENCSDNLDNDCDGLIDAADSNAVACPAACTDSDGDTYAVEGGSCGPVDCNDANAAVNPGAVDLANNGIDENCDGTDAVDPTLLDNDGDGFTPASGDCDDTDGAVNPGAAELCTDGLDNDCDGQVDSQDANATGCPVACTDGDNDGYKLEGGTCGPVDCDDQNAAINPGGAEVCDDLTDNDCDGQVDEGCDQTCSDIDGDSFLDGLCGGTDCKDNNAAINPGAAEVCGNGIDENCNGNSDDLCTTCPDGAILIIKEFEYNRGDRMLKVKGRGTTGSTITITNTATGRVLAKDIKVREGKWNVRIRGLRQSPVSITVTAANGCSVSQALTPKPRGHQEEMESDD